MPDPAFYDRWDLSTGVIALVPVSLVILLFHWVNSKRPSKMVPKMEGLLKETETLLYESLEDGLIASTAANSYRDILEKYVPPYCGGPTCIH